MLCITSIYHLQTLYLVFSPWERTFLLISIKEYPHSIVSPFGRWLYWNKFAVQCIDCHYIHCFFFSCRVVPRFWTQTLTSDHQVQCWIILCTYDLGKVQIMNYKFYSCLHSCTDFHITSWVCFLALLCWTQ